MVITFLFSISVKNDLHILKEHKKTLKKYIVSFNFSAYSQFKKIPTSRRKRKYKNTPRGGYKTVHLSPREKNDTKLLVS